MTGSGTFDLLARREKWNLKPSVSSSSATREIRYTAERLVVLWPRCALSRSHWSKANGQTVRARDCGHQLPKSNL
jgi:hypothetical protein